tara:strand:- start:2665 stop:2973 length:309 start_codon:yes stop_codon:yes gene_type:complete
MNRYKNTKIKRDKQLKVRYKSTTEYPSIQRRDSDIVYYSKYGDTYSNLAYRFYQDQSLWWVIAKANEGFKGDITIKPATRLYIPQEVGIIVGELNRMNQISE